MLLGHGDSPFRTWRRFVWGHSGCPFGDMAGVPSSLLIMASWCPVLHAAPCTSLQQEKDRQQRLTDAHETPYDLRTGHNYATTQRPSTRKRQWTGGRGRRGREDEEQHWRLSVAGICALYSCPFPLPSSHHIEAVSAVAFTSFVVAVASRKLRRTTWIPRKDKKEEKKFGVARIDPTPLPRPHHGVKKTAQDTVSSLEWKRSV